MKSYLVSFGVQTDKETLEMNTAFWMTVLSSVPGIYVFFATFMQNTPIPYTHTPTPTHSTHPSTSPITILHEQSTRCSCSPTSRDKKTLWRVNIFLCFCGKLKPVTDSSGSSMKSFLLSFKGHEFCELFTESTCLLHACIDMKVWVRDWCDRTVPENKVINFFIIGIINIFFIEKR